MAINYSWNCRTVDTYPTHSDAQETPNTQNDVIYNVHWRLTGTTVANAVSYSADVYGVQSLSTADLSTFTSFDSVTHDQVVAWVTGSMLAADSGSILSKEASIAASINSKITPSTVTKYIIDPVV